MDPNAAQPKKLKIMLIGDVSVGKTSFRYRYIKDLMNPKAPSTIGVEYENTPILLKDGTTVKVALWDTAGSEKYLSLTTAHYRGSHGALLFFDLTNRESFDHVLFWLRQIADFAEEETFVMLIGNRSDLSDERKVSEWEARELAKKYGLLYHETSAKTGANVKEAFSELLETIHSFQRENKSREAKEKQKEENWKMKIERNFGKLEEGEDRNESIRPSRCCC